MVSQMQDEEESKENHKALKASQKEIKQLQKNCKNFYDEEKMRRTVIKGIPCHQVKFIKTCLESTNEGGHNKEIFITEVDPSCSNLRRDIWMMVTKLDNLKSEMVSEHNTLKIKYLQEKKKDMKNQYKKDRARTQKAAKGSPLDQSQESCGSYDSFIEFEETEEIPEITSPE